MAAWLAQPAIPEVGTILSGGGEAPRPGICRHATRRGPKPAEAVTLALRERRRCRDGGGKSAVWFGPLTAYDEAVGGQAPEVRPRANRWRRCGVGCRLEDGRPEPIHDGRKSVSEALRHRHGQDRAPLWVAITGNAVSPTSADGVSVWARGRLAWIDAAPRCLPPAPRRIRHGHACTASAKYHVHDAARVRGRGGTRPRRARVAPDPIRRARRAFGPDGRGGQAEGLRPAGAGTRGRRPRRRRRRRIARWISARQRLHPQLESINAFVACHHPNAAQPGAVPDLRPLLSGD